MTVNWGARIAILYISFVIMIVTLVVATFRSKPVLVAQDYYNRETRFQEQLDAERAASGLETLPTATRAGDSVHIEFPRRFLDTRIEGLITCYVPSNDAADKIVPFTTETAGVSFAAPQTAQPFRIQIDWVGRGMHYYYQIP